MKFNRSASMFGLEIRSVWLRLILNPSKNLCEIINNHIAVLKQKYIIGVQLRLGGTKANYQEREMLPEEGIEIALQKIKRHVQENHLQWEDVYVFLSTDSDFAVRRFRYELGKISPSLLYTADNYKIGHSAKAKSSIYGKKLWADFTRRAIVDLMVLKESDFYLYSKMSSFGKFALELQKSYNNTVDLENFLYHRGLECSVFHKRQRLGVAESI